MVATVSSSICHEVIEQSVSQQVHHQHQVSVKKNEVLTKIVQYIACHLDCNSSLRNLPVSIRMEHFSRGRNFCSILVLLFTLFLLVFICCSLFLVQISQYLCTLLCFLFLFFFLLRKESVYIMSFSFLFCILYSVVRIQSIGDIKQLQQTLIFWEFCFELGMIRRLKYLVF